MRKSVREDGDNTFLQAPTQVRNNIVITTMQITQKASSDKTTMNTMRNFTFSI